MAGTHAVFQYHLGQTYCLFEGEGVSICNNFVSDGNSWEVDKAKETSVHTSWSAIPICKTSQAGPRALKLDPFKTERAQSHELSRNPNPWHSLKKVFPYKWEAYSGTSRMRTAVQMEVSCRVSISSSCQSQGGRASETNGGHTAVQIGGALQYLVIKLGGSSTVPTSIQISSSHPKGSSLAVFIIVSGCLHNPGGSSSSQQWQNRLTFCKCHPLLNLPAPTPSEALPQTWLSLRPHLGPAVPFFIHLVTKGVWKGVWQKSAERRCRSVRKRWPKSDQKFVLKRCVPKNACVCVRSAFAF